jgi:hypothetical protein
MLAAKFTELGRYMLGIHALVKVSQLDHVAHQDAVGDLRARVEH